MIENAPHSTECKIERCVNPIFHKGKGWCSKHYTRWQRHGDPLFITRAEPMAEGATEKWCPKCSKNLPLSNFKKRRSGSYAGWCIPCTKSYDAEYAATPVGRENRRKASAGWSNRNHEYFLRYRYGIGLDDYRALVEKQGNMCAICSATEPGGNFTKWAVDHCHDSSVVRGLLCGACNMAIGQFGDDPDRMRAAADYIEQSRLPK